jgi:N-acetylglucosamine-6-sulfatase
MPFGGNAAAASVLAGAALLAPLLAASPSVQAASAVAAPHSGRATRPAPEVVQPNIVVILTDDMRADELQYLPAVRRLQSSGVTFTRALSADSLCCPARATLLTGKLAHNHLTMGNDPSSHGGYGVFTEHNDIERLLPQWLDNQGYRTAWIGKYLNGIPALENFTQPDWNEFAAPVKSIYDYRTNKFAINGQFTSVDRYREVFSRQLLLSQVRAWSSRLRPFFVLYSALAPHKSRSVLGGAAPPQVQGIHRDFDPSRLVPAPSVAEIDLTDKPLWLQTYAAKVGQQPYPLRLEMHRVEALQSVNDTVADLVTTLHDLHETKRTLVIFTSDNGFMLREHDLTDKNKAYDESVHVPLVVRGPGFRGGVESGQTVSLADVTATIRRAAGVTRSHGADGVALQDVLAFPASFDQRPVEIEGSDALYPNRPALPSDPIGRFYTGAVWGPYSYVTYQTGDREFYDRSTDPWQLTNTYTAHPVPGSPQDLLQTWFEAHVDCQGPACNDRIPGP